MRTIEEIKILIADNDVDDAADALLTLAKGADNDLFNQTILLKSQLKDFTKREYLNIAESNAEKQRIVNALLQVADEVNRKSRPKNHNAPASNQTQREQTLGEDAVVMRGQQDVLALVWTNFLAFFSRDPVLYVNTLHEGNPQYYQTTQNAANIVSQNLIYQVKSMEVTRYDNYEAHVKTRVVARQPNNMQSGKLTETIIIIRRNNYGFWKIWGWDVQSYGDV